MSSNLFFNGPHFFPFPLGLGGLAIIFALLLWLWALVDCAKRLFVNRYEKAGWIAALVIFPAPALIAYAIAIKMTNGKGVLGQ